MGLIGKTTEEKIWNFLKSKGLSDYGAAGLMGNLFAESGLNPQNLQNSYEKKLGHTDASYTAAVDNGSYKNFARDAAGYGWHSGHITQEKLHCWNMQKQPESLLATLKHSWGSL